MKAIKATAFAALFAAVSFSAAATAGAAPTQPQTAQMQSMTDGQMQPMMKSMTLEQMQSMMKSMTPEQMQRCMDMMKGMNMPKTSADNKTEVNRIAAADHNLHH